MCLAPGDAARGRVVLHRGPHAPPCVHLAAGDPRPASLCAVGESAGSGTKQQRPQTTNRARRLLQPDTRGHETRCAPCPRERDCRSAPWVSGATRNSPPAGRVPSPALSVIGPLTRSSAFSWMQGRRHQHLPRRSGNPQTSEAGVGLLRGQTCNARQGRLRRRLRPPRGIGTLTLSSSAHSGTLVSNSEVLAVSGERDLRSRDLQCQGRQHCGTGAPHP
jgi:hypothetical protein